MLSLASNPHISLSSREFRAFTVTFTDELGQQLTGSQAIASRFTVEMTLYGWSDGQHMVVGHQRLFWMLTGEQKESDLWHL